MDRSLELNGKRQAAAPAPQSIVLYLLRALCDLLLNSASLFCPPSLCPHLCCLLLEFQGSTTSSGFVTPPTRNMLRVSLSQPPQTQHCNGCYGSKPLWVWLQPRHPPVLPISKPFSQAINPIPLRREAGSRATAPATYRR